MIHASIDGRKVAIPTQWAEVPYKDLIELSLLKNDLVAQVAFLVGMSKNEFESGTFNESLDTIFQATGFLTKFEINKMPAQLGKYIPGTEIRTLAQLNAITATIEANAQAGDVRGTMESMAMIAAIQCQGLNEPFDAEKARYLSGEFMNYPCLEVYETGYYFFAKAMGLVYRKDLETFRPKVEGVKMVNSRQSFFKRSWLYQLLKGR